ncbi:MAG: TerB family tellurite resistance protein [Saprospiraceae bacterium]|nr:TerB family tellurite resistance protein [Saprospiraceae bacterium]
MKPSKEKLYDALGELIYAVAKADGLVQESETSKLQEILQNHPWSREVHWSFEYEKNRETSLDEAYAKALDTCKEYGPTEEYQYLFDILYEIAKASDGLDRLEAKVIVRFKLALREHFMNLNLEE